MANVSSSNSQGVRVPKLRFPGFEGEWESHLLNEYLTESKIPGSDGKQAKKLSVKLWAKGVVEKNTIFEGSENTQYYIRKAGQLIYGKLDFLNCAFGIVPPELDGYESTLDAPAFDISNINSTFLLNRIIQRDFYKKNGDIANGSRKAKRIHPGTFLSMEITSPTLQEQEKIAEFIICLDERIEKQRQLVETLKSYKRGFLNSYISQNEQRWEKVRLSDILSERKEYCEKDGSYPHATLSKDGVYEKSDRYDRDYLVSSDDKKYKVTHKGDLCYNPANLKFGVICINTYGDAIFSPIYVTFEISERHITEFVGAYLMRPDFINQALRFQEGTVYERMAVSPEDLLAMSIHLPSKSEQYKFAEGLSKMQMKIQAEEDVLNKTVLLKKVLLSLLFI